MKNRNIYFFFMAVSLLIGAVSSLITSENMSIYSSVETPALSPPSVIFPIVWTFLFTLMGISAARIYIASDNKWNISLTVWAAQLAVNFVWSIIFFNYQAFLFAFIWLILLWTLILAMIILFYRRDKIASLLQIPYFLWVTFAGYLTISIYLLN
mgnify:CR=1 FL=1